MARTKGAKDIPKRKRAQILAKKNTDLYPNSQLAKENGVSVEAIKKITNQSVQPDVLEMSRKYLTKYLTYAEATAMKAQIRTFESVGELSADKAQKVAETAFNISETIKRTNTNSWQAKPPLERALELVQHLLSIKPESHHDADKFEYIIEVAARNYEVDELQLKARADVLGLFGEFIEHGDIEKDTAPETGRKLLSSGADKPEYTG